MSIRNNHFAESHLNFLTIQILSNKNLLQKRHYNDHMAQDEVEWKIIRLIEINAKH